MYKRGEDDLSIQKIMGAQFEFANDINTARKETSIESNEKDFSSILESKSKKCPYSMLARDGIIEYNGVIFSCDFDNNRISLGDMSDPKKVLNISDIIADVAVMILGFIMLFYGWKYTTTLGARGKYISITWLSKFWMYFPVPLAGIAMIVFEFEALYTDVKKICGIQVEEVK